MNRAALMRRKRLKFEDVKRQNQTDLLVLRDARTGTRHEIADPRLTEGEIVAVQAFTSTCLSAASPTPGLCEAVPSPQDFTGTSQWINTRCAAFNGPGSAPGEASMRCRNAASRPQAAAQ